MPVEAADPGRVPKMLARKEAAKARRANPDRCVVSFFNFPSQPGGAEGRTFEDDFFAAGGSLPIEVVMTDKSAIDRLLEALSWSDRPASSGGESTAVPTEVQETIEFFTADRSVGYFGFHIDDLRKDWGRSVADLVEPMYREAFANATAEKDAD